MSEAIIIIYYTAGMVQPKITTCTLDTVVITLGNLASFPSYSRSHEKIAITVIMANGELNGER